MAAVVPAPVLVYFLLFCSVSMLRSFCCTEHTACVQYTCACTNISTYKILLLSEQKTRAIMTPEYLARNQIHDVTLLWLWLFEHDFESGHHFQIGHNAKQIPCHHHFISQHTVDSPSRSNHFKFRYSIQTRQISHSKDLCHSFPGCYSSIIPSAGRLKA